MKNMLLRVLLVFGLVACLARVANASPQPSFKCDVENHPNLVRGGINVGEFIYHGGEFVGLTAYPRNNEKLPRVVSGSGEQYSDGVLTFHSKGDQGILMIENGPTYSCRSAASEVIERAKALGTIVRATPKVGNNKIDKLPEGEPIELIEEVGNYHQDFQWFKIRYGEGQEGYAWGGTLCVETEMAGILIDCSRFMSSSNPSSNSFGVQAVGQSLFGSIIRNAPSAQAGVSFKIAQGTRIEVIGETGNFHKTWQWVKIRAGGQGVGFVWGGTICTTDRQLVGVHFGCRN